MSYARRFVFMMLLDAVLLVASLWVAFLLRFDGSPPPNELRHFFMAAPYFILFSLPLFCSFGLYRPIWQYSGLLDYLAVLASVTLATLPLALGRFFRIISMPYGVLGINWGMSLILIGGARAAFRLLQEFHGPLRKNGRKKRILIVGAGQAGALLLRELRSSILKDCYEPVGFIDDDPAKQQCTLNGLRILGGREAIPSVVAEKAIDEIFIAIPSAPPSAIRAIVALCRTTRAGLKILPGLYQLVEGRISIKALREVAVEDLLGRAPVAVDLEEIASYLQGKRVLVTGAGGSIGSELCRQIARFNPEKLLLLGRGEGSIYQIHLELSESAPNLELVPIIADVRDRQRMDYIFGLYRPSIIFHAAAHKHVPFMEEAPDEAIKNNVFGTLNVAELAHEYKAKSFVLISTDKAVRPTSVMGATKRLAEAIVQDLAGRSTTRFCAVRFGNVLGSRGSVVPLFQHQIARGGPVTVTDERMIRYFMTIPEAASLVIQAGAMGKGGEIFVLDLGEPVRIIDLARELIRLSGLEPGKDIEIVITGPRPGEKLFEEVLTAEEGMTATKQERLFVAKADPVKEGELAAVLAELREALAEPSACRETLRRLVPHYSPAAPAAAGSPLDPDL